MLRDPVENLPLRNSARLEDFAGIDLPAFLEEALDSFWSLNNIPGIPIAFDQIDDALEGLLKRSGQLQNAKQGLTTDYTISGHTEPAMNFMFHGVLDVLSQALHRLDAAVKTNPKDVARMSRLMDTIRSDKTMFEDEIDKPVTNLTTLFLDSKEAWSLPLTNFHQVLERAQTEIPKWQSVWTDPAQATAQFWPMLAENGMAFNLLMLQKASPANLPALREKFGDTWHAEWEAGGPLFFIDLSIFSKFKPQIVDNFVRFTPGTITLLRQEADKSLTPFIVRVADHKESHVQIYERQLAEGSAWIYALLAARCSATVYGVWLGHVYHWHLVSAAMLMGFFNHIPTDHPLYPLVEPQSRHLLAFDQVLLLLWKFIAPPTSFGTSWSFLQLADAFGEGRDYFQDDPKSTLARHGLSAADFTVDHPWDRYPIVASYLRIWDAVETYVGTVVDHVYPDDDSVANDVPLGKWMEESADPQDGNLRGIPQVTTRADLKAVLTSLLYRITVHGCSRLERTLSPTLNYQVNFPITLQKVDLPNPIAKLSMTDLMRYLPNTGTIGDAMTFYGIFTFSDPYQSFIPLGEEDHVGDEIPFPGPVDDPRNQALIALRRELIVWMKEYQPANHQLGQWPRSIET